VTTPDVPAPSETPAPPKKSTRWQPGQSGNPKGRMRREHEDRLYEVVVSKVTPEALSEILDKAITDAKAGDKDARAWLGKIANLEKRDTDAVLAGAAVEVRIIRADDWRVGSGSGEES
jgi:hypothetical protein